MQESRDKGRTKTNGESDASFGGLGARPAMEGWRWTDPFVGRRGGDATPGTALRCRRAGRALGFGVREVANTSPPPPPVAARRPDESDAPTRSRPPPSSAHACAQTSPFGCRALMDGSTNIGPTPSHTTHNTAVRPVGDRSSNTVDPGNSRACRFHDGGAMVAKNTLTKLEDA